MPDTNTAPVSLSCRICGGKIVNDYLAGSCVCSHCGNQWSLEDLIPDYTKYSHVIVKINKANDILDHDPNLADTEQARIMFQSASSGCEQLADAIASELMRFCREGQTKADKIRIYIKGKTSFDNKGYDSALEAFGKIPGFKDADELAKVCREQIAIEKKKMIPWAVIIGMVLPAILCIFLKEYAGLPLAADIPIFLAASAGCGYLVYMGGVPSVIVKILSFVCAVPLIIFMILAYAFHVEAVPSLIIAVGTPIAAFFLFSLLAEKKK